MDKPLITIVVPVYNGEKFIGRCIDSVLQQTYGNIEVIVVDDGSIDKTADICDTYISSIVRVIHKKNEGASIARNTAIAVSRGKYIAFVDADDYVEKNYIEKLYCTLVKSSADLAVCGYYKENEKGELKVFASDNSVLDYEKAICEMFENNNFGGYPWNKLFKTDIVKELDLTFNSELVKSEDMLWCCQYLQKCKNVVYISEPLYHYMYNGLSVCRGTKTTKKFNKKELTNITAHRLMERIIQKDTIKVKNAFYCRLICTCMRLLVNMGYGEYWNKKLVKYIHRTINKHILVFVKSKNFGIKEKGGAILMAVHPKLFWNIYMFLFRFFGITIS